MAVINWHITRSTLGCVSHIKSLGLHYAAYALYPSALLLILALFKQFYHWTDWRKKRKENKTTTKKQQQKTKKKHNKKKKKRKKKNPKKNNNNKKTTKKKKTKKKKKKKHNKKRKLSSAINHILQSLGQVE